MSELAASLGSLSQREFRVGRTLSRAIGVFMRNALPFTFVAFAAWLPVGLIYYDTLDLPARERELSQSFAELFDALFQVIALAAITHATFQDLHGRPVRIWESAKRGLMRFLPLTGAFIVFSLGAGLGLVLLIVPGLLLLVRWYVFAPVCVVEWRGPLGSLKRSAALTEGYRWKLFAILVIINLAAGAAIGLASAALASLLPPVPALFLLGLWQAPWSAFNDLLSVVIYHDLRVAKEGADIESIASVFD